MRATMRASPTAASPKIAGVAAHGQVRPLLLARDSGSGRGVEQRRAVTARIVSRMEDYFVTSGSQLFDDSPAREQRFENVRSQVEATIRNTPDDAVREAEAETWSRELAKSSTSIRRASTLTVRSCYSTAGCGWTA